jgi:alkanesulfonate monooxygenase SsuD/methylene tetrahydromethanopterin reductase-like flavin-dependent oxidoreductase (luciferase family)
MKTAIVPAPRAAVHGQRVRGEYAPPHLAGLGFSEDEIRSGSDRLVGALTACGGPTEIAARMREHLDAGADHVMVMLSGSDYAPV